MRTVTAVQASFGFCCFCAAAVTVTASSAATDVATDVTASGSSYSFCAAAATATALDASNFSEGRHSNKKGRETCLFCYHFLFFRKCCSRSFCSCRFRSASVICPFFFFRCKPASSSSYTRFPSMINRPMDFLLKTGSNCYLASQLYLFSFYHMHILFSLS